METRKASLQNQPILVDILSLGKCTLLPITTLPPEMRTYEHLTATATGLDLIEFGELNHEQRQAIFKSVVLEISKTKKDLCAKTSVDVIFSGVHASHPLIDLSNPNLPMVPCVTVLQIYFGLPEDSFFEDEGTGKADTVDYMFEELSISAKLTVEFEDLVYGLFLGEL